MATIARRTFLAASVGAVGAAVAAAPAAAAARTRGVRVTREDHRVVIVGSGFGGGVTALRLAQAGVPVTVLERGIRWPSGPNADTFPNPTSPDKRVLWVGSNPELFGRKLLFEPYPGLVEAYGSDTITTLVAAGVGGGSPVYQGMTLQPSEAVFNAVLPPALDWQRMNREHYPRVARMLQIETAPDALIDSPNYKASRVFARNVRRAGYEVEKIPMPIDWSYALAELRGEMKPAYTNGGGTLGVNNGGKHSVDVTYVKQAEATGRCTVKVLHNVTDVVRGKDGRWEIHVDRLDMTGTPVEKKILTTPALVLAAGTVNTSKLLVRAKALGQIPDLPSGVGAGYGTNGDRIYVWTDFEDALGAEQGGPVVYGTKEWDDPERANTVIQASFPPLGLDARSTAMVGFGVSRGRGTFRYDAPSDSVKLDWRKDGDAAIWKRIHQRALAIVGPKGNLLDQNGIVNQTWHPLGGAAMGSVCDLEGRVQGQKGLYVLDGALIPGTTGACNPSMTIAAVAERALDDLVRRDVGTLI